MRIPGYHGDTMQKAMDFFWLAGFSRTFSPLLGVLCNSHLCGFFKA
jgi:hypothetical protein